MSLFSTITHREVPGLKGLSPRGIGMMVLVVVLGAAIGFVISQSRTATETAAPVTAAYSSLAHDDFVRLNTTELPDLSPAAPANVIEPAASVDQFWDVNVDSYAGLIEMASARNAVDPDFLELNTKALEYPAVRYTEPSSGPR